MFCFDEVETCLRYEMGTYNISYLNVFHSTHYTELLERV